MKNFVTQDWLLEHINDSNLILFDARAELSDSEYGIRNYKDSHIANSHFVSLETVMAGEKKEHGGRHPLPEMNIFLENMKSFGVNDDSIVVIYDDGDLAMAGRLWWMLKFIGHKNVFLLEGGIYHWSKNGLATTQEIINPLPSSNLTLNIQDCMIADINEVKEAISNPDVAIIDSRSFDRYSGKCEPIDKIAGHIPSALNYFWLDLAKDGVLMDIESVKERFKDLNSYEKLIVHCGSGITGTVNLMFLDEIGINAKLYVGGYSDWISYPENKIETK